MTASELTTAAAEQSFDLYAAYKALDIAAKQQMTPEQKASLLDNLERAIRAGYVGAVTCCNCGIEHTSDSSCAVPVAPWYVTSIDTFMSGWGGSEGRNNLCVVPCASLAEAGKVEAYMRSRKDQKYINTCSTKPRERGRRISLLLGWRERALGR